MKLNLPQNWEQAAQSDERTHVPWDDLSNDDQIRLLMMLPMLDEFREGMIVAALVANQTHSVHPAFSLNASKSRRT